MWEERLAMYLEDRPEQLRDAKEKGLKIIGHFPGNYVPEELIVASGAIPVCLVQGGDTLPLEASLSTMPDMFCPFARTLVGEKLLKRNPYYNLIDMLVAPITCQHLKKATEIWEYHGDIEIFKLGIPHQNNNSFELEYFTERLTTFRELLQRFTGNEITDGKIRGAIELYNRMREILREISVSRRSPSPPLDAMDFLELNHASFYVDPVSMIDILESVRYELRQEPSTGKTDPTRLILIGPNISRGDYNILELIRDAGGLIVIEEVYEGMRRYWQEVNNSGDPLESLALYYLKDRVPPPAFMRYSTQRRFDFALKLITDFNVSGVIWYELACCETYDAEAYFFKRKMEELKIPMLILESDYGMTSAGQAGTRLEAFMEMIKG
ncbi:2-hydroxyacyl-CoA dehydratase family protein [Deltaproteobacteria bacterium]|nr:2-hydroxyacyl-CoA dehydratase family protein [Deltaproteobacteria bacterium]